MICQIITLVLLNLHGYESSGMKPIAPISKSLTERQFKGCQELVLGDASAAENEALLSNILLMDYDGRINAIQDFISRQKTPGVDLVQDRAVANKLRRILTCYMGSQTEILIWYERALFNIKEGEQTFYEYFKHVLPRYADFVELGIDGDVKKYFDSLKRNISSIYQIYQDRWSVNNYIVAALYDGGISGKIPKADKHELDVRFLKNKKDCSLKHDKCIKQNALVELSAGRYRGAITVMTSRGICPGGKCPMQSFVYAAWVRRILELRQNLLGNYEFLYGVEGMAFIRKIKNAIRKGVTDEPLLKFIQNNKKNFPIWDSVRYITRNCRWAANLLPKIGYRDDLVSVCPLLRMSLVGYLRNLEEALVSKDGVAAAKNEILEFIGMCRDQ